jgi:uroporphyrinogen-III synthase
MRQPAPRILITRFPHQASALAEHLRTLGAEPILIPTIEIVDPASFAPLDAALAQLDRFHWLLFTSANAVEAFHRRLGSRIGENLMLTGQNPMSIDQNPTSTGENQVPQGFSLGFLGLGKKGALAPEVCFPAGLSIAAIGPATARALEAIGLTPNLIPPQAVAESLADALISHVRQADGSPTRFLLIRAEEAREHLPETLRAASAEVTIAPAYRTVIPAGSVEAIRELFSRPETTPDAITFTSSSTARNLFALLEAAGITLPHALADTHPKSVPTPLTTHPEPVILSEARSAQSKDLPSGPSGILTPELSTPNLLSRPVIASIGPITSETLRDLGYPPQVEATEANVASLAENLVKYLNLNK